MNRNLLTENKKILNRTMVTIALLGLAALIVFSAILYADDDEDDRGPFTNSSIRGTWGFSANGTIVPPAADAPIPAVAVGTMTFDGAGGCFIADTININGQSFYRTSDVCIYTVNPDGTGTIEAQFPGDPEPVPLSFVIVNKRKELRFIRTDLGVASGVAKRQ
jgi:hypothetical protein